MKAKRSSAIARYYLAGLLGLMALGQLLSWQDFTSIVGTYGQGDAITAVLAPLLTGLEIFAAIGLLQPRMQVRRWAAYAALTVTLLWALLAVQAFARGLTLDNCGCFGRFLGQPLRWWILLEDAAFVALAVYVWRRLIRRS
jgi:hypothetical protein